jgi:DNA-binding NarL/FixJ family response regulator
MADLSKTYIFCLDDHKNFSEDVKKRFSDSTRYVVGIFHNRDELMKRLLSVSEFNWCKVAILGIHDSGENFETTSAIAADIRKSDKQTGIIILVPSEKSEAASRTFISGVNALIPRNSSMVLRIHNAVKKIISEHNLNIYKSRRNWSLYILASAVIIALAYALYAWFRHPEYF